MLPPLTSTGIGAPMRRVEDVRLLRGAGRFVDNIAARARRICLLRSPLRRGPYPCHPDRGGAGHARACCWC